MLSKHFMPNRMFSVPADSYELCYGRGVLFSAVPLSAHVMKLAMTSRGHSRVISTTDIQLLHVSHKRTD